MNVDFKVKGENGSEISPQDREVTEEQVLQLVNEFFKLRVAHPLDAFSVATNTMFTTVTALLQMQKPEGRIVLVEMLAMCLADMTKMIAEKVAKGEDLMGPDAFKEEGDMRAHSLTFTKLH